MNDAELKQRIKDVGPWHYCWELAPGIVTGDSAPNLFPDKMPLMIAGGAFSKPAYKHVLDLGSNSGYIPKWLVDNFGSRVVAIENSKTYYPQLALVVEVLGYEGRIIPVRQDICDYKVPLGPPDEFDLVTILGVMHHLPRICRTKVVRAARSVLKDGGEIVVQTESTMDVPDMLAKAGFKNIKQLYHDIQERSAWLAEKEAASVPKKRTDRSKSR